MEGVVKVTQEKIVATTQQSVEIAVRKLFVVSQAEPLPLQIEDAARPKSVLKAQVIYGVILLIGRRRQKFLQLRKRFVKSKKK